MTQPHDPNITADIPSVPPDSLDAGLAAGFGRRADGPQSVLTGLRSSLGALRPVLLREAEGESEHVVKPKSDAMPSPKEMGDRYHLSGEIARGGMGVVLRGRDNDLGRDLAFKVLLEKYSARPEVARRFIEEAQIAGQLQHPGVVPVYDIGRFGERPFFTMKLVKGRTLAAILNERTDSAQDRPRLLNIAIKVAETLAYAHAKGVIHRDLKPANIMVGAFGEVQVMDWGLAKVLAEGGVADEEQASRMHQVPEDVTTIRPVRGVGSAGSYGTDTEAGSLLGTPAYMPPEQANGDIANIDRRSDVFGLGAILCEILTGMPPYAGRSNEEVRRKAANGSLDDATARLDACGADAELIVLTKKCLAAESIDRPKDAQTVADALTAYLDGVQARLQTAERERAVAVAREAEQRKKRKVQLALAASVLTLVGVVGAGLWVADRQAAERRRERDIATLKSRQGLESALDHAEAALRADKMLDADAALAQAEKLRDDAPPDLRERLAGLTADRAMVAELERIFDIRMSGEGKDNVIGKAKTKAAYPLAFAQYGLDVGNAAAAAELVRRSPIRDRLLEALDIWLQLDTDQSGLPDVLIAADPDEFRTPFRRAIAANDVAKVSELCRQVDGANLPPRFAAVVSMVKTVTVEDKLRILQGAWERSPTDFAVTFQLGWLLEKSTPPRITESLAYYRAAVALNPKHGASWSNLSVDLLQTNDRNGAILAAQRAVALQPGNAIAWITLGNAYGLERDVALAIPCYRKAIELDQSNAGAYSNLNGALTVTKEWDAAIAAGRKATELDPNAPDFHVNLGRALHGKLDLEGSIVEYRKAIALDPRHTKAHYNLSQVLTAKGDRNGVIVLYRDLIARDPYDAQPHVDLGVNQANAGDLPGAIASFREAIRLKMNHAGAHYSLGLALFSMKDKDVEGAIASYQQVIRLTPKFALAYTGLAQALTAKGDLKGVIVLYRDWIVGDPENPEPHVRLGVVLGNADDLPGAIASFREATRLKPNHDEAHFLLGQALFKAKKVDGAIASFQEAVRINPKNFYPQLFLGIALKEKKSWTGAAAAFREAIRIEPKQTRAYMLRASALAAGGQSAEALREILAILSQNPTWADDPRNMLQYNAACYAMNCADGKGSDVSPPAERPAYRKQALQHLTAELAAMRKTVAADRAFVNQQMHHWLADTDLVSIRDPKPLANLPEAERKDWEKLWADVHALRAATAPPENVPPQKGPTPREVKP